jgi:hypothetical protein
MPGRNRTAEVRKRRVVVVPKGAWDRDAQLPLYLDERNGGRLELRLGTPVTEQ